MRASLQPVRVNEESKYIEAIEALNGKRPLSSEQKNAIQEIFNGKEVSFSSSLKDKLWESLSKEQKHCSRNFFVSWITNSISRVWMRIQTGIDASKEKIIWKMLYNAESSIGGDNPQLRGYINNDQQLQQLKDYVQAYRERLAWCAYKSQRARYVPTGESSPIPYDLFFTPDNKVYVRLSANFVIDIDTDEVCNITKIMEIRLKKATELSNKFKDTPGFLPVASKFLRYEEPGYLQAYLISKPLQGLRGDLNEMLKKKSLSKEEKRIIIKQIITSFLALSENGFVHRDLRAENVCIVGKGREIQALMRYEHSFADPKQLKLLLQESYIASFGDIESSILPPNYVCKNTFWDTIDVGSHPTDMWALGLLLDEIVHDGERKIGPKIGKKLGNDKVPGCLQEWARKDSEKIEKPSRFKGTIEDLILQMLKWHERDRLKVKELKTLLESGKLDNLLPTDT